MKYLLNLQQKCTSKGWVKRMTSPIPAWALFFFPVMCGIMAIAVLGSVICWCCRERENGKNFPLIIRDNISASLLVRVSQKCIFSYYFCKLTNCALGPPKYLGQIPTKTLRVTVDQFTNEIHKLLGFLGHPYVGTPLIPSSAECPLSEHQAVRASIYLSWRSLDGCHSEVNGYLTDTRHSRLDGISGLGIFSTSHAHKYILG